MEEMNIPPKGKSTGRKPIYKLSDIEPGQNRLFKGENVRMAVSNYQRRMKEKGIDILFTCRKEEKGIRVYRTK
jgi:hypothetical protein